MVIDLCVVHPSSPGRVGRYRGWTLGLCKTSRCWARTLNGAATMIRSRSGTGLLTAVTFLWFSAADEVEGVMHVLEGGQVSDPCNQASPVLPQPQDLCDRLCP